MSSQAPKEGDIVYIDLSPVTGHEQGGSRPVLVVSPFPYNAKTGMAVVVPLTTSIKGYPFEVPLEGTPRPTVALADAVRNIDWNARRAVKKGTQPPHVLQAVRRRIAQTIGFAR